MFLNNLFSFLNQKPDSKPKSLVLNDNAIENIEEFIDTNATMSPMNNQLDEFQYIEDLIKYRLNQFLAENTNDDKPELPSYDKWHAPFAKFIKENELSEDAAVLLLIAFIPHIQSDLFDRVIQSFLSDSGDFPKLGGVRGKNSRAFLPTGETALFLLAGDDWKQKLAIQDLFGADHFFEKREILWLEDLPMGEPVMSGRIILSQEYAELLSLGHTSPPKFSSTFPAQKITSNLTWDDVVLNAEIKQQIEEIETWTKYGDELLDKWKLTNLIKPGFRALFYGPPGTGKTLTAGLIGNLTGRDVYKIDISTIVSKYIGETEKNLSSLFARAENKNWILFFDEADAIFGKRTGVKDAHDKYANQEVSYLLQRIENFNGMVILASNQKSNIDDAFIRRFNVIANFAMPNVTERAEIWKKSFPSHLTFENVDFNAIAQKYELAGGNIINVVHYACLKAYPSEEIKLEYILDGIRKEYNKDGKMFKA